MNDGNDDFDDYDDLEDFDLIEDEPDASVARVRSQRKRLAWKRIESIRDRMALRQAVSDFDDYHI